MKSPFLLFSLTVSVVVALAADPLTEAFQRGLLAEESQRDLKAAAAAYDEVMRQADAQRELVATALFRLAETQRRLGRTNESLAGYRRLVREFSDQTNLTGLAVARLPEKPAAGPGVAMLADRLARAHAELETSARELAELTAFLERAKTLPSPHEMSQAVQIRQPTQMLTTLRSDRNVAEQALARLRADFSADHPEVARCQSIISKIDEQLEREVTGILSAYAAQASSLERQMENQRRNVHVLEAKLAQERNDSGVASFGGAGLSEAMQLLAEEIRLAEAQVAEIQRGGAQGKFSQAELLQAQRDVLGLKRQAARLRQSDLVDLSVAAPTQELPELSSFGWVSVLGEVNRPGVVQLPKDRPMDVVEAIAASGNFSTRGNRHRIQLRRGTNLFRLKFDEVMTNRVELKPGDAVEVMEKVF